VPAGTAGGDHQVAPILEVQGLERRVIARARGFQALIGGMIRGGRSSEVQAAAPEQRAVVELMAHEQQIEGTACGACQGLAAAHGRVRADILVGVEARGRREQ